MNKALHALVYVILAVAGVVLYFELNLFEKKDLLTERNRQLEDYLINISRTIEKSDAPKSSTQVEARKDSSPIEAKVVDTPEMENVLEDYPVQREEANLETLKWDDRERVQLRNLYLVRDGEKIPDPANPGDFVKKGPGTAQELLDTLFERAKAQQANLNSTRAELAAMRTKLEAMVADYNKLPPDMRQDKVTIEEQKKAIAELEQAKTAVEEQLEKTKSQVGELNTEIASLKDEVTSAKEETEAVKEDLAKVQKQKEDLLKLLQQKSATPAAVTAGSTAVAVLTAGNKGKLVDVNNTLMFAVVEFSDEAMTELLGPERQNGLPLLEMGLRRPGFAGASGEFIGRIRLRQAVQGKNFVIADILGDWKQTELKKGDVVFAE
jgi:archaellum component FlaC